jgi:hypothetical protein
MDTGSNAPRLPKNSSLEIENRENTDRDEPAAVERPHASTTPTKFLYGSDIIDDISTSRTSRILMKLELN